LATLNDHPGGIRGRVNPANGSGYAVWLYPTEGLVKLYRNMAWNIDSGFTLLGQASVHFDTLNFHNVQLLFLGSQIQVLYDGGSVINAMDTVYPNGLIALDVSDQVVTFGNALVTSNNASIGSLTLAA